LDRKLITEAGRKNVIGKPILFKTTKEFLIQFGLKDLSELPTLKEFEEIRRMALSDSEIPAVAAAEAEAVDSQAVVAVSDSPAMEVQDAEITTSEAAVPVADAPVVEAPNAPQAEAPAVEPIVPESSAPPESQDH